MLALHSFSRLMDNQKGGAPRCGPLSDARWMPVNLQNVNGHETEGCFSRLEVDRYVTWQNKLYSRKCFLTIR